MSKTSINSIDDLLTKDVKVTDVIEEVLSDEKNRELFSNAYKIVISTPDIMSNILYKGDSTRPFLLQVVKKIGELLAPHFNSEEGNLYVCYLKDPETGELVPFTRERYEKWKPLFMFTYLFDIDTVDRELVPAKCRDPPFWVLMNQKPYVGFLDEKTFQERVKQGVLLPDYIYGMEVMRKLIIISDMYELIGDFEKKKEFQDKFAAIKKKAYQESKTIQSDPNVISEVEKLIAEEIKKIKQMFPNYDELYDKVIKTYPYLKDVFSNANAMAFPIGDSIVFFLYGVNNPFPPPIDTIKLGWVITSLLTIPFYSANLINEIEKKNKQLEEAYKIRRELENQIKRYEAVRVQLQSAREHRHELVNFLAALTTNLEVLNMMMDSENLTKQDLDDIRQSLKSSYESANKFFQFTKKLAEFDRDKSKIKNEDVNVEALVRRLERDYGSVLQENNMNLQIEIKASPVIYADPNLIYERIFRNLMQNIVKHSQAKNVKIKLETGKKVNLEEKLIDYCLISFEDDGIGMDKKLKDRIFILLTTKDLEHKAVGTGGIGCPVALETATLYNGDIEVESEPGKGTIFRVYLPLKTKEK